jgi:NADPH:quinone reductase-like Zn-dependent oxidoreductase
MSMNLPSFAGIAVDDLTDAVRASANQPQRKVIDMKIVVIGGTGLIGSKVVQNLRARGHEAVAAAPNTGVNTITGEGLDAALAGAQVVVDVANSPSFERFSSSSRPPDGTCSRRRRTRASGTTSRSPSSAPTACPTVDTCGPSSPRSA